MFTGIATWIAKSVIGGTTIIGDGGGGCVEQMPGG